MISRKEVASAYECCIFIARKKVRNAGINHRKRLTLEEFKKIIQKNGWPTNKHYQGLAQMAMENAISCQ